MKTTIEIDDDLLLKVKSVAVRRRTTMKAIFEHALRREILPSKEFRYPDDEDKCYEVNEDGLPQLKRVGKGKVTSTMVYELMEEDGI